MPTLSALTRCDFYPRSPCGERLPTRETYLDIVAFLSTLSLRRATGVGLALAYNNCISIHALLAESDLPYGYDYYRIGRFLSTLSLRRATARTTAAPPVHQAFLSTLSLRRATCIRTQTALPVPISIHALLAESDQLQYSTGLATIISIHALLAESDFDRWTALPIFLISIHALLAESDRLRQSESTNCSRFLSTLSLRRATGILRRHDGIDRDFYPRSPCGERQAAAQRPFLYYPISIHALLAESDWLPDHDWWLRC